MAPRLDAWQFAASHRVLETKRFDPSYTSMVRDFTTGKTQETALQFESASQRLIAEPALRSATDGRRRDDDGTGLVDPRRRRSL